VYQDRQRAARAQRREAIQARMAVHRAQAQVAQVQVQEQVRARGQEGLASLANDRQNVHTTVVVNKVQETIRKVLLIPVPPDYQTDTLKTSGEIILECRLSRKAAWQMMAKYCGDENIYDLGQGIYAKVLNSVWQFIKASPDVEDLKKILASEMEDNIGMCAQGNLSRLCNILSGYMEELNVDMRSTNEILGPRLAALMELENYDERENAAIAILGELHVPPEQWQVWIEPLRE
jgi:hypothetical protein